MNETFEKIKARHKNDAITKSALISVSVGAFVFGALLLAYKLLDIDFSIIFNIVIPFSSFLIALLTTLLIFLKSDIKIARELDAEFSLAERVETMIRFRNSESDMLAIQRENTNEILSKLPTKKPFVIRFLSSAIAFVLALGMLIPSLIIDKKITPQPVTPFVFSEWDEAFMNELKETVKKKALADNDKDFMISELDSLHTALKTAKTEDEMHDKIVDSIVKFDLYADNLSTFKEICVAIDNSEYSDLKTIARLVLNLNGIGFGEGLDDIINNYKEDTIITNEDKTVTVVTLNEKLTSLGGGLKTALETIEGLENDALYTGLMTFAASIETAAEETDADKKAVAINDAFANASTTVGKAISIQYTARSIEDYITAELIRHFNIPKHLIPLLLSDILPTLSSLGESGENGESKDEASGGYGDGNELFGVSGVIYNPYGENGAEYVVLDPDTLDIYYKRVEDILRDDNISLQIKQILTDYFRKLSDGTNPDE